MEVFIKPFSPMTKVLFYVIGLNRFVKYTFACLVINSKSLFKNYRFLQCNKVSVSVNHHILMKVK